MQEHWGDLSIALRAGDTLVLQVGGNQGKFHSQDYSSEVTGAGAWGAPLPTLPDNTGFYGVFYQHHILGPAAAAAAWETGYCWKVAFSPTFLCGISFRFKILSTLF